jgi:hypothetical protein
MKKRQQVKKQGFGVTLVLILVGSMACIGTSSGAAAGLPRVIAPISADVPIAAGGGWLVWSVPVHGGWGLEAYHGGAVEALPVASRPGPFDVNVGTNAQGKPVATFSRCTHTPEEQNAESGVLGESTLTLNPSAGCRLHALNLATDRERILPVSHPAHSSDTTPSMWHGEVAFARMTPAHADISQVRLWSWRHPNRLRVLPGGEVPSNCMGKMKCHGEPVEEAVKGLDLNADVVTFLWSIKAPGIVGHEDWEVRVDSIASGHGHLAGSGFLGEACVGGGLELALPETPITEADQVLFSEFRRSSCYHHLTSSLYRYRANTALKISGPLLGNVLGLAKDGQALYALLAPAPALESDPGCSPIAPCVLEQIVEPRSFG